MPTALTGKKLDKFLEIIAYPSNERETIDGIFQFLLEEFKGMYFSLWVADSAWRRRFALLVAERGYRQRGVAKLFSRVPEGMGAVGRALESKQRLILDISKTEHTHIAADEEFIRNEGITSIVCIPALAGTEVQGVLLIARRDGKKWKESEIETLSFVSSQAIAALARASRRTENRILVQMLSQIHMSLETRTLLVQIAKLLCEGLTSDNCTIVIRGRRGEALNSYGISQESQYSLAPVGIELAIARVVIGTAESRRLFSIADKEELASMGIHLPKAINSSSISQPLNRGDHCLAAPIMYSTVNTNRVKAIGAILLFRDLTMPAFLPQNETAVLAIGKYLGLLFERTRILQSMEEYLDVFRKLGRSLMHADSESILEEFLPGLAILGESAAGYAALCLEDGKRVKTVSTYGDVPKRYLGERAYTEIEGQTIISGTCTCLANLKQIQRMEPKSRPAYKSELCIPLKTTSSTLGIVRLFSLHEHAFLDRDVAFAMSSCAQVAVRVENISRKMVADSRLVKLLDITAGINSAKDLAETIESVVSGAVDLFDADFAYVAMKMGNKYSVTGSKAISEGDLKALNFQSASKIIKRLLDESKVIVSKNAEEDADLVWLVPKQGNVSCILGSIVEGAERIGFITVCAKPGKYAESDKNTIETMQLLCRHATIAILRAKLREEQERVQRSLREQQSAILAGTLSMGIGHQIGKYMNRLSLSLENMKQLANSLPVDSKSTKLLKGEIEGFVDSSMKDIAELSALNQTMLRFGSIRTRKEHIYLNDVVREYVEGMKKKLKEQNMTYTLSLDPNLEAGEQVGGKFILADPGQIGQVLIILMDNAMDAYEKKNGRIDISTRAIVEGGREYATLIVRDYGIGMDDDQKARLMEPFFTTKPGGHGLGLQMIQIILKNHDGKIDFESVKYKGTLFRIFLPLE